MRICYSLKLLDKVFRSTLPNNLINLQTDLIMSKRVPGVIKPLWQSVGRIQMAMTSWIGKQQQELHSQKEMCKLNPIWLDSCKKLIYLHKRELATVRHMLEIIGIDHIPKSTSFAVAIKQSSLSAVKAFQNVEGSSLLSAESARTLPDSCKSSSKTR